MNEQPTEQSNRPSHDPDQDTQSSEESELEEKAVNLAHSDQSSRLPGEPVVWFVAMTDAEAAAIHLPDIPRMILDEIPPREGSSKLF